MNYLIFCLLLLFPILPIKAQKIESPNQLISVESKGNGLVIAYSQQAVLEISSLGFEGLTLEPNLTFSRYLKTDYTMLTGKRRHCTNEANEYRTPLVNGIEMVVRLYNDGIAFRYELSSLSRSVIPNEQTAFRIPEGTRRWMQQWTDSYEGFFPLSTTYKIAPVPSFSGISKSVEGWNIRWGYPALIEPIDGVFTLITEADISKRHSASCLYNERELYRVKADVNKLTFSDEWHTPWRIVIIGKLADIVESTLVNNVSEPCRLTDISWIHPGVVSWIYWAHNHGSNDYSIIKQYVDLAVALRLPYVLIDAEWDTMKDGYTIEDAVNYAKSKGVKPMIWYNSSVGWVDGAPTPKYRLNHAEDREREFAWCEQMGIAGIKIDFFSGDSQMNMAYCIDLLECAARHHLLVNFHGASLPRGWQRTYPNLLSTEGVYGAEWYNNVPTFTAKAAAHNATLPFTRNVVGSMDYTPCAFSDSQHPHITTHAHELALTVLFESGLQHLADRPESLLSQPIEVQHFLSKLPTVWDETRYVAGYPEQYAVLARRSGDTWYIAGINGKDTPLDIKLDLDWPIPTAHLQYFNDLTQSEWIINTPTTFPKQIRCLPRGGFIIVSHP